MKIRTAIEAQRRKLNYMTLWTDDLTKILGEAQKMDRMIEMYEDRQGAERKRKDA